MGVTYSIVVFIIRMCQAELVIVNSGSIERANRSEQVSTHTSLSDSCGFDARRLRPGQCYSQLQRFPDAVQPSHALQSERILLHLIESSAGQAFLNLVLEDVRSRNLDEGRMGPDVACCCPDGTGTRHGDYGAKLGVHWDW